MDKEKELWLESIGAKEYPEPVKYAYTFPGYNGAFNLSEKYIKENSLEELKAQYERNRCHVEKVKKAQGNFQQNYVNSEVMRASKEALTDLFMKCSEKDEKRMDRIEEVIGHFNRLREGRKEPHMDFGIGKREDAPKMTNNFCQMGAPDRINRILLEYDPDYEYFLLLVFPQE